MHKLKAWFWPHRHNHFHPHLLRPVGLGIVVAMLAASQLLYNYTSAQKLQVLGYATSISSAEVIALSNQRRAAGGLGPLATNAKLNQAAYNKAQHMIANNYWAHNAPDGTTPWYFIKQAGYSYATAGENLAKDFDTSAGVVNAWMNSAAHKANIMNGGFVDTGVAVVNGTLLGQQTTLVVAMYASPTAAPIPTPAPTPAPTTTTTKPKTTTPAPQTTTIQAQPAPTPTPAPTPEAVPAPATPVEEKPQAAPPTTPANVAPRPGSVLSAEAEQAIIVRQNLNWARSVSIFMLSVLLLVMVLKHTIVWRTQRRGWRHVWLRAHPAAQYGLIIAAIVLNIGTSVGVIK